MITEKTLEKLKIYLDGKVQILTGELLTKNSGYDGIICSILTDFTEDTSRYWDAKWETNNMYIEFKKGKSIWLDLVRYSEILLKINDNAKKETITLFFIPNSKKTRIEKIIGLKTSILIRKLGLEEKQANFIIDINNKMPRSFNAQASLTVNDILKVANFIVENKL